MNLNVLRYVIAVAEEKSVRKAARKLFIAQPSISQSIHALEDDLGVKLFDHGKSPLLTTAAGDVFIGWAREVLLTEQQMRGRISDIVTHRLRKLRVGISPIRNRRIITDVLHEFYKTVSNCSVILCERGSKELELLLEQDSIDMLIDQPIRDTARFESIAFADERILVAAPESYGFTVIRPGKYPSVSVADLVGRPFILLSGNKCFDDSYAALFKHTGTPRVVLECLTPQVALGMVSRYTGVSLIPEYIIENETVPNVRYYSVEEVPLSRVVAVTYRKDKPPTEDAAFLISLIRSRYAGGSGPQWAASVQMRSELDLSKKISPAG